MTSTGSDQDLMLEHGKILLRKQQQQKKNNQQNRKSQPLLVVRSVGAGHVYSGSGCLFQNMFLRSIRIKREGLSPIQVLRDLSTLQDISGNGGKRGRKYCTLELRVSKLWLHLHYVLVLHFEPTNIDLYNILELGESSTLSPSILDFLTSFFRHSFQSSSLLRVAFLLSILYLNILTSILNILT